MYIYRGKLLVLSALARAMTKAGYKVHVSHVSRVFQGEREATKDFVAALARVVGITRTEAARFIEDARAAYKEFEKIPKLIEEEK